MVGAAIAAAGWRRRTALATPAAIIAANIPDIDIVTVEAGDYASLALRRGWTHGPPAVLLGAVATVGIVLLWHRMRRRRDPDAPRARPRALLALCLIAAVTHPLLDWMNTYGIRFLMPFDRRWFYGDSLFIIDPWLWLVLGVPLFLIHARTTRAVIAWGIGAALATIVVVGTGLVPLAAKAVWLLAMLAAAWLRQRAATRTPEPERTARTSVLLAVGYIAAMVISSNIAAALTARAAAADGIAVHRLMIAPRPARPLHAQIVVETAGAYHLGTFGWLDRPRITIDPQPLPAGEFDDVALAAAQYRDARDFLTWSRFPIVETRALQDGFQVRFGDARYVSGPGSSTLGGLTVRLDSLLQPVERR
jgi:inner membrane protein